MFRLPVELACGESLMPLHSVTASALLKSMLSSKVGHWGFLSEGIFLEFSFFLVFWFLFIVILLSFLFTMMLQF